MIQLLGGEYAASREFLESVPFAAGYGVEIGLLLDAHIRGLDRLASGQPGRAEAPQPVTAAVGRDGPADPRDGAEPEKGSRRAWVS